MQVAAAALGSNFGVAKKAKPVFVKCLFWDWARLPQSISTTG
jgi:hypothetical protein